MSRNFSRRPQRKKAASPQPRNLPEIELSISGLTHEGKGVGHHDGKAVFVAGALPEETVRAKITLQKKRFDQAVLQEIIKPSQHRVEPRCEHYQACGGCSLQHLAFDQQLFFKEKHLLDSLQRIAGAAPESVMPAIVGPQWHYRRKARLSCSYDKKAKHLQIGFREKESKNVVDVRHCPVMEAPFDNLFEQLSSAINALKKAQFVSHIELLKADNCNAILIRHVKPLDDSDKNQLIAFAQQNSLELYLQGEATESPVVLWADKAYLEVQFADIKYQLGFQDFLQVNAQVNTQMLQLVTDLLQPEKADVVLDLFCGFGNLSLAIANTVAQVIGVEGSEAMVRQASENAALNAINNTAFYQMDLTQDLLAQ
ncbi:MAG: 23S rRNA (uracil(1939)-C(5))-methyltransferase RlmD, partial [Gammaproteobacteria bacterium]|nr:23S rRNA (uracil(1939)-C(5))-methyltransferase RlmD [Gammaproteobacteria bacterium]